MITVLWVKHAVYTAQ